MSRLSAPLDRTAFPSGASETAALIRSFDWSKTSLGPIAGWPRSLKAATSLMLQSRVPMVMLWGVDGVMIYNDAYSSFAGKRHPKLLGSNVREGWPEAADFNDNVMKVGLAGGSLAYTDQELTLYRNGRPEQVWMNLDYSPVLDESGRPVGVIAIVIETTERVLADRRAAAEQERQRQSLQQMPGFVAVLSGPEHVYEYVNDAYVKISQRTNFVGRKFRDVFADLSDQAYQKLLDQVYASGDAVVMKGMELRLHGSADVQYIDFLFEPIRDDAGKVSGIFIGGYEVTDAYRATAALRESEARLRFLDALSRETATSLDADAILATTTRMVGEYLGVSICAYADMDEDQDGFTIRGDWSAPGSQSIVGRYSLAAFGKRAVADLGAGRPLIIEDSLAELALEEAATFRSIGIAATICMPLIREGRLTALMAIHNREPRAWSQNELALLREVTERSWAHIERLSAEAELRTNEENFRTLARAMPNHAWTSPPDGMLDWFNEQVYAYSGLERDGLVGQGWARMVHPDDIPFASARWAQALSSGESYEMEFRLRRADGEYRWHIARAVPIKSDGGEVLRWIGTNTDIHDQKQAVEALASLNADLERQVLERTRERGVTWKVSPDLLSVMTPEGMFETVNPAWTTALGWTTDHMTRTPYINFVHPDDVQASHNAFDRVKRGDPVLRFENRYRHKSGEWRWLSWVAVPVDGKIYCSARDVTPIKEAETELAAAQDALRQAQKMEAIGHLTGGIAHDFNNLLAAIIASVSLIERRLTDGKPGAERYISAARDAAQRAAALTQRLLAFSRRQTLDPASTDLNTLVSGMEDLIRRTVGPGVEVEVAGADGLWAIRVDRSQLENALLNLCINARDAMAPDGGSIRIETANRSLDQRAAKVRDLPPGHYVSLSVTDTGTGMSPETQTRAFDPFFTTKPIGQGTGLGLSMIYGFVRQSGGQVRITSEVGKGTTMRLYLPRHHGAVEGADEAVDEPVVDSGDGETILVIDDEAALRMLIGDVLAETGYRVTTAPDGPTGLEILRSDMRIDLLITDVGLPGGMNGRQVADAARIARPDMKVLFITGYAENAAIGDGHLEPGMEVLTKPFEITELGVKVREMLER
ncbi:MAG: PAS domain-containing protein [Phycisphaerales bacterium]|nr:PAS domain-containing protein [Hyphomonadaceae bacterium]